MSLLTINQLFLLRYKENASGQDEQLDVKINIECNCSSRIGYWAVLDILRTGLMLLSHGHGDDHQIEINKQTLKFMSMR